MKKFAKMAVAAAIAAVGMAAHATLLIDDFSTGQAKLNDDTVNGLGYSSSVLGAMIGGNRDLFVEKTVGTSSAAVSMQVDPNGTSVGNGALTFAEGSQATGRGIIRWDGVGVAYGDPGTPTGPNFSAGISESEASFNASRGYGLALSLFDYGNAFKLTVNEADFGFIFSIVAYTDATNYTTLNLVAGANGQDHTIPFALFYGPDVTIPGFGSRVQTGSGANFSNVNALEAIINATPSGVVVGIPPGVPALDLSIDTINVVPEPGTMALTGLALLGLGAMRRRKAVKTA